MESSDPNYFFLALLLIMPFIFYLHAKNVRSNNDQDEYYKLRGDKLRFKSATFNGNHYSMCIEYLVSDDKLGIRCTIPKFNMVVGYQDIKLSKSKALIGSLVCMEVPNYEGKIEITHKLAKRIDKLSNGKFGYSRV